MNKCKNFRINGLEKIPYFQSPVSLVTRITIIFERIIDFSDNKGLKKVQIKNFHMILFDSGSENAKSGQKKVFSKTGIDHKIVAIFYFQNTFPSMPT